MRLFVIFITFMIFARAEAIVVSVGADREPVSVESWQLAGVLPPPPIGLERDVQMRPFLDVLSFVKGFAVLESEGAFSPNHTLVPKFWQALTEFAQLSARDRSGLSLYALNREADLSNYYLALLLRHQEGAIQRVLEKDKFKPALRALRTLYKKFSEDPALNRRPFWQTAATKISDFASAQPLRARMPQAQLFHLSSLVIALERLTSNHACLVLAD